MNPQGGTRNSRRDHRQHGSTVIGVMVGLLIGVVIAIAVALYINLGPKPFVRTDANQPRPEKDIVAPQSAPVSLPGKPGDAPVEKPHFDFYKILPGGDGAAPATAPPAPVAQPAVPDHLYLQVGAFQDPSEADNLKARLALMGLEASVQRSEIPDKGVMHRVRVGPFNTVQEVDAARVRLAQEGIESNLVRSKSQVSGAVPVNTSTNASGNPNARQ